MTNCILMAILLTVLVSSCGSAPTRTPALDLPQVAPTVSQNEFKVSRNTNDQSVKSIVATSIPIGCWSSYNGNSLNIGKNHLVISTDHVAKVRFERLDLVTEGGGVILRLNNRPRFYFFQNFLAFSLGRNEFDEEELKVIDAEDPAGLHGDRPAVSLWVRKKCE